MLSKRSGKAINGGSGNRLNDATTSLRRQNLDQYNLAKCADGTSASYFAEKREVSL